MRTKLFTLVLALAATISALAQSDFVGQFAGNADYTVDTMNKQQIAAHGDPLKVGEIEISGNFKNLIDSVASIVSASPEANARLLEAARKEFSEANGFELMASGTDIEDGKQIETTLMRKKLGDNGFCTVIYGQKLSPDPVEAVVAIIIGPFDIFNPFKDMTDDMIEDSGL